MKKIISFIFLLFLSLDFFAQSILISEASRRIYRVNLNNCSSEFIVKVDYGVADISFDPSGNLYGVNNDGEFFHIDTLTGKTKLIHAFNQQKFNSLAISIDFIAYAIGKDGALFTYDILGKKAKYLGNIGFSAAGDLTFYDGNIYAAVLGNKLVKIDISKPSNSKVVLNANFDWTIFGLVSFAKDCDKVTSYAFNDSFNSKIFKIDYTNNSLTYVCSLDFIVTGGASTYEFLNYSPLVIENVSQIEPQCGLNNGQIQISAKGGIGNVEYSIDNINYQSTGLFPNLSPGKYSVYVRDRNNCILKKEIDLPFPNIPTFNEVNTKDAYCGEDNGYIELKVQGGIGQIRYSLDSMPFTVSNVFSNLKSGTYSVHVIDAAGCQSSQMVEIKAHEIQTITSVTVKSTSCGRPNGSIVFESNFNNLQFSLDGNNYRNTSTFSDLSSGVYNVLIKDQNNCLTSKTLEIEESSALNVISIESTSASCGDNEGSLKINTVGGVDPIKFALNNDTIQLGYSFENLPAGAYKIKIFDKVNCIVDTSVVVLQDECPIYIPNIFSPNDDGLNDVFLINHSTKSKGLFKSLKVFDRWGSCVFEASNFKPGETMWDGTNQGMVLEAGVYVYFVEYVSENGKTKTLTGDITMIK